MLIAMTRSPARRLIIDLAAVTALFNLAVLLPGNPYSSRNEFVIAVLVQALVVWGLWRGSAVAWYVAIFFAVGMIVTIALIDVAPDVGFVVVLVLSVVQAAILSTREVRIFVASGRTRRT